MTAANNQAVIKGESILARKGFAAPDMDGNPMPGVKFSAFTGEKIPLPPVKGPVWTSPKTPGWLDWALLIKKQN